MQTPPSEPQRAADCSHQGHPDSVSSGRYPTPGRYASYPANPISFYSSQSIALENGINCKKLQLTSATRTALESGIPLSLPVTGNWTSSNQVTELLCQHPPFSQWGALNKYDVRASEAKEEERRPKLQGRSRDIVYFAPARVEPALGNTQRQAEPAETGRRRVGDRGSIPLEPCSPALRVALCPKSYLPASANLIIQSLSLGSFIHNQLKS
ncbi:unnamed protein product [Nezara viridula]|uniref:Uncharacterized protein n=1 Tax=Nezara viridula TaxID=85310 RepID=A0A9P0H9I4_NEZVI|nr:unnamed protein product [Nezara viridula]